MSFNVSVVMCKLNFSFLFSLCLLLVTSSAWAEDPIQVVASTSSAGLGILGCTSRTTSTRKIRIQSLKTSSGVVFHRRTLDEELLVCFEIRGNKTLAASNILECAEATKAAGLQMFLWEDDATCTGYVQGIPKHMSCKTNGNVVVYSVDNVLFSDIYIVGLYHGVSSLWAQWDKCHPDYPNLATKFELTWNGTTIHLNGSTLEYRLYKSLDLCHDDLSGVKSSLLKVTLAALDDTNTPVMKPMTKEALNPVSELGNRHVLNSGNCLYHQNFTGRPSKCAFSTVVSNCESAVHHGNLFTEFVDGDFVEYMSDLAGLSALATPVIINNHVVGLRNVKGQWKWLSDLPQGNDSAVWASYSVSGTCTKTTLANGFKLTPSDNCCLMDTPFVCHEFLP